MHTTRVSDLPAREKPWGYEKVWAITNQYVGKSIFVRAGESLSLQFHRVKTETMLFTSGTVVLTLGEQVRTVGRGDVVHIPPGCKHRLRAVTDASLIEVSTPELDDVVRLVDDYGRDKAQVSDGALPVAAGAE